MGAVIPIAVNNGLAKLVQTLCRKMGNTGECGRGSNSVEVYFRHKKAPIKISALKFFLAKS
ncbi:hypothetical protein BCT01_24075 [Vibrio tasmaniensis]|nr:hypothetical protein A162_22720 [Vibrio tasmaniensis 1F-155]PMO84961.1 hypothetical protein BCT01_24075 [Vibrio tasmaniensis]